MNPKMTLCDEYDENKEPDPKNSNEYIITEEIQHTRLEATSV